MTDAALAADSDSRIADALHRYWGYDQLRPLQSEAIQAGLERRDSLVVLPTGGGKSLCYQIPAVIAGELDVVVSPLISLMKDQVDALRQCGYPAAAIHSNLTSEERTEIHRGLNRGEIRLLFVSPERLAQGAFIDFLQGLGVRAFAIDEAHCISQWGHDFRPEYRQLALLKERFPGVSLHAYTATATERVRGDIAAQLRLEDPHILVGIFDRPNLAYRVLPKVDVARQVIEIIRRHPGEAAIVYCLSRKDTEALAATLVANGVRAAHYHAGLEQSERTGTQDAFAAEEIDVVVATVAFGMGIDRSNVRCVIHASTPKSIEHYQQETGRAGRDGLEAECVLLYSYGDVARWEGLMDRSGEENDASAEFVAAQKELLHQMKSLASTLECRHRALSRYFGQRYEPNNCDACDVCLGEVEGLPESTTVAQKILSAVARTEQRFGVGHVAAVLRGANSEQVRKFGHDQLSVFGLLPGMTDKTLTNLIYQLVDMGLLARTDDQYPVLVLGDDAVEVLRGERPVHLVDPGAAKVSKSSLSAESWEGVDRGLFEELRQLRKTVAQERGVPAYVVFGDETLRGLARVRPTSPATMQAVKGVGSKKLADLGPQFVEHIDQYCQRHQLATDVLEDAPILRPQATKRSNPGKEQAMALFAEGVAIEDVAEKIGRAVRTTTGYLEEFIAETKPTSIDPWVDPAIQARVVEAAVESGEGSRLRPLYEALGEEVSYEAIRVTLAFEGMRYE